MTEPRPKAIGYVRVSTRRQDLSPQAQAERLRHRAAERGYELVVVEERVSARSVAGRAELRRCLDQLARGEYVALLTDKMDRVSRNLRDFLDLDERSRREGWALVVLNLDFDSSSATGRLIRTVMAAIAEWEREMIGERTTEALAAKRATDPTWRPGAPVRTSTFARERVRQLHDEGRSLREIAADLAALHADDVRFASATGAPWTASMVRGVLRSLSHDLPNGGSATDTEAPPETEGVSV